MVDSTTFAPQGPDHYVRLAQPPGDGGAQRHVRYPGDVRPAGGIDDGHRYRRRGNRGRHEVGTSSADAGFSKGCDGPPGGRTVPPLSAARLDRARKLFDAQVARGNRAVLITSGGQGPDEHLPESRAMADYPVAHGVPEERIVREDLSRNTEENLRFCDVRVGDGW